MFNKKTILITSMCIGILCYFSGFIWYANLARIIMMAGSLLIYIPLLLLGLSIRKNKKILSNILVAFSVFQLIVTVILLSSILIFNLKM